MGLLQQTSQSTLRTFQLFHSATKEEYEEKLRERQHAWDATFEAYYMQEIHLMYPPQLHLDWEVGFWKAPPIQLLQRGDKQPVGESQQVCTHKSKYMHSQSWFGHIIGMH